MGFDKVKLWIRYYTIVQIVNFFMKINLSHFAFVPELDFRIDNIMKMPFKNIYFVSVFLPDSVHFPLACEERDRERH